jgi:hypothetical protein
MKGTIGFYIVLVSVAYLLVSPIVFAAPSTHLTATHTQHSTTSSAHPTATPSAHIPTYNIGILFPNASEVRKSDPALNNMILTSELAIQLAQQKIRSWNILPGKIKSKGYDFPILFFSFFYSSTDSIIRCRNQLY